MTGAQWADGNFYLSPESSQDEGRWTTLPYQVAWINAMCGGDIERVAIQKSARVGYTKCLMASAAYWLCYKRRSVGIWSPVDDDRTNFVKKEIEPAIRDSAAWREAFPAFEKQHRDNTTEYKKFGGCFLQTKGGKSARNFRGDTLSVSILDEFDAFDHDIENEGSGLDLAEKRTEGAKFPKLIVGSTPKEKGTSQIEAAVEDCEVQMRFHVPCPHCGNADHIRHKSLKWEKGKPDTVALKCEKCELLSSQSAMLEAQARGFWKCGTTGITTKDGLDFYRDGERVKVTSVGFYIWAGYSHIVHWRKIAAKWIEAQGKPLKLKSYVNQTLGETWEDVTGESLSKEKLNARCEEYEAPLPSERIVLVTAGVDVHGDRFEVTFDGWGPGMECWTLGHKVIPAETDKLEDWQDRLAPVLEQTFQGFGMELAAEAVGIDTRYRRQTALRFCQLHIVENWLALHGVPGDKPLLRTKPSFNRRTRGLDIHAVGVDSGKDTVFSMLSRESGPASTHFPDEGLPPDYFEQVTAEKRRFTLNKKTGQKRFHWHCPEGRRNEAFDCKVYSLAALEWLRIQRRVDLDERYANRDEEQISGWDEVF